MFFSYRSWFRLAEERKSISLGVSLTEVEMCRLCFSRSGFSTG